jgi:histidinol-phosphate/aromatic aminotransferase/cobyric acid decarboxylase-like protein
VYERYPCPYQQDLKTLVGGYRGVDWTNVFVGVGSDEAIDMLVRIFCVPGKDSIIINPPTYGMYSVSAATNDVGVVKVPLTPDFEMDVEAILGAANSTTKMVFLCSPGNPACKLLSKEKIVEFLESDYNGIVVVDEAYIDFAPNPKTDSCCDLGAQLTEPPWLCPAHSASAADDDNTDNIPPMIKPNTLVFVLSDGTHARTTRTALTLLVRSDGLT